MALVVEQPIATFDLSEIARGDLVYGKHRTWPEGKAGFVTSATEKELIVQYHPGIGNVRACSNQRGTYGRDQQSNE